jgi:hypothetical protein
MVALYLLVCLLGVGFGMYQVGYILGVTYGLFEFAKEIPAYHAQIASILYLFGVSACVESLIKFYKVVVDDI